MGIRRRVDSLPPSITEADALSQGVAAIANFLPTDFQFLDSNWRQQGSDITIPAVDMVTSPSHALSGYDLDAVVNIDSFAGELKVHWKGNDGTRGNVSIFGFQVSFLTQDVEKAYTCARNANAGIFAYSNKFNDISVGTSSGAAGNLRNYVTYQRNSYWEDK
jgi:hypothetical protein